MLDVRLYQEKATAQFEKMLKDKVEFLAKSCWPVNIKYQLNELNRIIEAGKKMEVTEASILSNAEIEELVKDLSPLRTLEMTKEIYGILERALTKKGIDPKIVLS